MPLKEESPTDTGISGISGISDVPVFSDPQESTAKSTPTSTVSNGSQLTKPEDDDVLMTLSAAGATIASVTILDDAMPATPFSLAATPRHCSPHPAGLGALHKDTAASVADPAAALTNLSNDASPTDAFAANPVAMPPLATPPEGPLASLSAPVPASVHDEPAAEPVAAEPMDINQPTEDEEAAIVVDTAVDETARSTPRSEATPQRQSRRISSRQTSNVVVQPQPPPPEHATRSGSPARRPSKAARLSEKLAQNSPDTRTATPNATPKAAPERRATRLFTGFSGIQIPSSAPSTLGKRSRRHGDKKSNVPRELRRLEDTKEFSHVDDKPVVYTVWSNGKYVPANAAGEPLVNKKATKSTRSSTLGATRDEEEGDSDAPKKKTKLDAADANEESENDEHETVVRRRVKKWLDKGLYAGQAMPSNPTAGLTPAEKRHLAELPELIKKYPENKVLPIPIFTGMRTLIHGRDFKMPFDVFNPLPPGQPKPVKYGKFSKNRFVGEAHAIWRKNPDFDDFSSKCVCKPETGCDEDCQNRIMLYECDNMNCNVGPERCNNREFQRLAERTASKNPYHIGVEVFKTPNRGHGIRASRSFRPGQIIMEYIGEIITEEESDRRMNELYKNNACYYLMSFDQSLIIDGTSGSIARFVNHSCSPNCRMIKWIVSGQPRIALFAGDRPIMTGEELTYDYNFDFYSSKNVQKCLCGSENCRGILGPRKSDKAVSKAAAERAAAERAKASAAKLKSSKSKNAKQTAESPKKRKANAHDSDDSDADEPAAKKARVTSAKRGPGRPRTRDSGKRAGTATRVTSTKAALAALAAKAAIDARIAKATKAAKAARTARAAKAAAAAEAAKAAEEAKLTKAAPKTAKEAKTSKIAKTAKSTKEVKVVKRGVKVTKTVKGLKAMQAPKTTRTDKAVAAKKAQMSDVTKSPTKRTKSSKAAEIQRATAVEAGHESTSADGADGRGSAKATPMARALAKAAKEAAKATKAAKTARTLTTMKPKSAMAKRATNMAAAAAKQADKAKKVVEKTTTSRKRRVFKIHAKSSAKGAAMATETVTGTATAVATETATVATEPAETLAEQASIIAQPTADVAAAIATGALKEAAKPSMVASSSSAPEPMQQSPVSVNETPRRRPGRPPSAKKSKGTTPVRIRLVSSPLAPGAKRPVGRPRKYARQDDLERMLGPPLVEDKLTEIDRVGLATYDRARNQAGNQAGPQEDQTGSQAEIQSKDQAGDLAGSLTGDMANALGHNLVRVADSTEEVIHVASGFFKETL